MDVLSTFLVVSLLVGAFVILRELGKLWGFVINKLTGKR